MNTEDKPLLVLGGNDIRKVLSDTITTAIRDYEERFETKATQLFLGRETYIRLKREHTLNFISETITKFNGLEIIRQDWDTVEGWWIK
jgi:hypothetical protein